MWPRRRPRRSELPEGPDVRGIGCGESAHSRAAGMRTPQEKRACFGRSRGGGWSREKGNRALETRSIQGATRCLCTGPRILSRRPGDGPQVKGVPSSKDDGTGSRGGPGLSRGATACRWDPSAAGRREWGTDRVPTSGMALPAPPGFLESSRCRGQPGYCGFSGETKAQCLRGPQAQCLLWVPLSGSRSAFAPVWDPDGAEEESGVHSGGVGALTSGRPSDGRPLSAESGVGARGGPCSG